MKLSKGVGASSTRLAGIFNFCVWMNWIPGYEFKKLPKNIVEPQIQFFPGQRIRAYAAFVDGSQQMQISKANWLLSKHDTPIRTGENREQTFDLPPESGIYELSVTLRMDGETRDRHGAINIDIVDIPVKENLIKKETKIPVESVLSPDFLDSARKYGIEVYRGKGEGWKQTADVKIESSSITIPQNTVLPNVNGQVLMRIKGEEQKFTGYSAFPTPIESK
jgi:hypothetical protein